MYRSLAHGENFSIRYKVVADESLDNVVVLDGAPAIDNSRREKLLIKISKEFAKRGSTISVNNITVPWDDSTGKSKGSVHPSSLRAHVDFRSTSYLFMEFKTREDADYAINAMNNVPFDSKHTFRLNHFLDVEKYAKMDPTYVEPETEVYKPGVRNYVWPRRSPSDPVLGTSARLVGRLPGKGPIRYIQGRRSHSKLARKAVPMRGCPHQDCTSRIPVERSPPSFPRRTGRTYMFRGRRKAHISPPYTVKASAYGPALRGK